MDQELKNLPDVARRGGAYLVAALRPSFPRVEIENHLDELAALGDTAGFSEAGRAVLPVRKPTAATYVGRGQAEEVGVLARSLDAQVVIVDEDLSPAQVRNLEKTMDLPVVDRAGLIIDIFAQRARSREARTQVEIAQLEYLLPRLAGRWAHLSRQVGGGPGGLKGAGEKQIELDRRMIRRRIDHLHRDLSRVDRGRGVRRRARQGAPQVALVGYTNVGKSSLFNALTGAAVRVENRLFATLDPTVRRADFGRRGSILVKDTVGFIRKLPHHLVAAFRSTFDEIREADLLLLVVDISHPQWEEQRAAAQAVLEDTELGARPLLIAYNKVDVAPRAVAQNVRRADRDALLVSARTGAGLDRLVKRLADRLLGAEALTTIDIPQHRGDLIALLQKRGAALRVKVAGDHLRLTVRAPRATIAELRRRLDDVEEGKPA